MLYSAAMPADCAVPVSGSECGVLAIGRCANCGTAFCESHRGMLGLTVLVDRCTGCSSAYAVYGKAATPTAVSLVQQRDSEARRIAALSPMPREAILGFLMGTISPSGGAMVVDGVEFKVAVRSVDLAAVVPTLALPGPFKHKVNVLRQTWPFNTGERKPRRILGWLFMSELITGKYSDDTPGHTGFLLSTEGAVARFSGYYRTDGPERFVGTGLRLVDAEDLGAKDLSYVQRSMQKS